MSAAKMNNLIETILRIIRHTKEALVLRSRSLITSGRPKTKVAGCSMKKPLYHYLYAILAISTLTLIRVINLNKTLSFQSYEAAISFSALAHERQICDPSQFKLNNVGKTVLVTSGAGYLGAHTAIKLKKKGFQTVVIDALEDTVEDETKEDRLRLLSQAKIPFVNGNICDEKQMAAAITHHVIDRIVYIEPEGTEKAGKIGDCFLQVLEVFVEKKLHDKPLIYTSITGDSSTFPDSNLGSNDRTLEVSTNNELAAFTYNRVHNVRSVGLRIPIVYGPSASTDSMPMALVEKILKHETISPEDFWEGSRELGFISDITNGIAAAIEHDTDRTDIYDLGNTERVELAYVEHLVRHGLKENGVAVPALRKNRRLRVQEENLQSAQCVLGWQPRVGIESGIEQFLSMYRFTKETTITEAKGVKNKQTSEMKRTLDTTATSTKEVTRTAPKSKTPICVITSSYSDGDPSKMDKMMNTTEEIGDDPRFSFYFFTNMENHTPKPSLYGWEPIVTDFPYKRTLTHSRWPKFMGWKHSTIQTNCETVLYLDASSRKTEYMDIEYLVKMAAEVRKSDVGFAFVKHQKRYSIRQEYKAIVEKFKDTQEHADAAMAWMRKQGDYVDAIQIYEMTYFLYDVNSEDFHRYSEFFWGRYSLELDSWRDQPYSAYAMHHMKIKPLNLKRNLFAQDRSQFGFEAHTYVEDPNASSDEKKDDKTDKDKENNKEKKDDIYVKESKNPFPFRILCTTPNERQMNWGSYTIRCKDLNTYVEKCATTAHIDLMTIKQSLKPANNVTYNATVIQKHAWYPKTEEDRSKYGKIFVDVNDNYRMVETDLEPDVEVIVQAKRHATEVFPNHAHHVVEHWFNSFPQDQLSVNPVLRSPKLEENNGTLQIGTIWNVNEFAQTCPEVPSGLDIKYDCINEEYNIADWYKTWILPNEQRRVGLYLTDPKFGPGRVYYQLFRYYDILVVPAKVATPMKTKYGNVQRAVSQMRSGVPILLEVDGEVLEDFVEKYNYPCVFSKNNGSNKDNYLPFDEAITLMHGDLLRRKFCQKLGLRIAKDYSMSAVGQRHLEAIGYEGGFTC